MSPPDLRFGPFFLEAEPLQLRRGAEQVVLRPKSLEVLRYLAERPGRLVSKQELLEHVWSGWVISQDGLRVCVREIRAALGDNPAMPQYLETVNGKGYRFLEGRDGRVSFAETTGPVVGRESELHQLGGLSATGERRAAPVGDDQWRTRHRQDNLSGAFPRNRGRQAYRAHRTQCVAQSGGGRPMLHCSRH